MSASRYKIFVVDDDINAVRRSMNPFINNNQAKSSSGTLVVPSNRATEFFGVASSRRVVASPGRASPQPCMIHDVQRPVASLPRPVKVDASLNMATSIRNFDTRVRRPNASTRRMPPSIELNANFVPIGSPNRVRGSKNSNNNNLSIAFGGTVSIPCDDNDSLDTHQLSRDKYLAKYGYLSDAHNERKECSLIAKILDNELSVSDAFAMLKSAELGDAFLFLKSNRGSRFVRDTMDADFDFHYKVSSFIVCKKLVCDLAFDQNGNFVIQQIPGKNSKVVDEGLCAQLTERMPELTMDKYGCRVIQAVFKQVSSDLVKKMVAALDGCGLKACQDKNGAHVVQCLLDYHRQRVFEPFFQPFVNQNMLRKIMGNQFGCRIVQKCLEAFIEEITVDFVPPILNNLVVTMLQDAGRYIESEYANYVIQKIISYKALERQRDYVIDHVLLGHLLHLSQGKFSSHVVETALHVASSNRLNRMCSEVFHDYNPNQNGLVPLEVMLFDRYGNYVVQKLLSIAIAVHQGRRVGDPNWIYMLVNTVDKHREHLFRYSSGKKIIETLEGVRASLYGNIAHGVSQR